MHAFEIRLSQPRRGFAGSMSTHPSHWSHGWFVNSTSHVLKRTPLLQRQNLAELVRFVCNRLALLKKKLKAERMQRIFGHRPKEKPQEL